ncbi:MAG: metallophosphoesterase [Proteobacteria bacterium]|nr:metallophosphoesterase [Pseudomonadota bacterium]
MTKLLVFADLHIQNDPIIGLDPVARFKAALAHALANHMDAQGIVLMGDLVHGVTAVEYEILKSILADVPLPITYMMGNHDRREVFLQVFAQAALGSNGFVQSAFDLGEWRGLTLDTLDGPPYLDGLHSGRLCPNRLAWLADQLDQAKDKPVVLFTHHPLGDIGFPKMDRIRLENGKDVIDMLKAHPRPVHVLSGHVHRTVSGQWDGISYTGFKSTCHQNPLNLRGQYASMSVDQPGAYGVILFDGPNIIVHSEDYALAQ